jgi:hypothetical protein
MISIHVSTIIDPLTVRVGEAEITSDGGMA